MMNSLVMALSLVLLLVVLLVIRKRQKPSRGKREESLLRLEEVLRSAQLTNNGFFQSLELVQKNLEALLARAESAEQRLRSLMLQPGIEKKDQYTAAALLLGEGQEPQRVASMLSLPLPQIQIVSELQKLAARERKPAPRRKRDDAAAESETASQSKIAARREKNSPQPLRLVDVIRKAAAEAAKENSDASPFRGINA
jgi:hypothetical protein